MPFAWLVNLLQGLTRLKHQPQICTVEPRPPVGWHLEVRPLGVIPFRQS